MINPPLASTAIGVVHHSRSGMASGIQQHLSPGRHRYRDRGAGRGLQHDVTSNTRAALADGAAGRAVLAAAEHKLSGALVSGDVGSLGPLAGCTRPKRPLPRLSSRFHRVPHQHLDHRLAGRCHGRGTGVRSGPHRDFVASAQPRPAPEAKPVELAAS
jgi:hypothetical protein